MTQLKIVHELEVNTRVDVLEDCWSDSSTFILVPDKGVNPNWVDRAIDLIPPDYIEDCFGLLTSGSTGQPKLILGDKKRSEKLVRLLHQLQDSEPVVETLDTLPLTYCYAFINQWLWARVFKRRLRLTQGFSEPDHLKETLSEAKDAMLCLVGGQVALLQRYYPEAVFPGVIRLHFAGGRFPQERLDFLHRCFPNAEIYNNYGCAEALPRLTMRRAHDASEAANIGHTLPGIEMKSDDQQRLLFRSPYGAVAYINDEGFHPIASDNWIPSGDLGEQLDDGSWRLLGRANEIFKRFGEKISIPQLLTTVKRFWDGDAVFYKEADSSGEQACVLVLSPDPSKQEVHQILMGFRDNHPRPHWPLRIESLDHLPLLPSGKADVQSLANLRSLKLHWRQRI